MGFSGRKPLEFLQTGPQFVPGSFRGRGCYLAAGDKDNLGGHTGNFGGMHADKQVPLCAPERQPALDEIIARLEIETGKRFVQAEQFHVTHACENFGEENPRLQSEFFLPRLVLLSTNENITQRQQTRLVSEGEPSFRSVHWEKACITISGF
jgi:hypothetical protein